VRDVVVSPDGGWAVTVGEGGAVLLWDVDPATGRWEQRESLAGHGGDVVDADVDPTGTRLFTASVDDTLVQWDLSPAGAFGGRYPPLAGRYVANRPQLVEPDGLLVAPTRSAGAAAANRVYAQEDTLDVTATFLDPGTGRVVDEVPVGATLVGASSGSSVSVSPDGRHVAVTSGLATTVLDSDSRDVVATFQLDALGDVNDDGTVLPAEVVWCAGWTPDGTRLLLGAEGRLDPAVRDGGLVVVNTGTWEEVGRVEIGAPQVIEASPDGRVLAVGLDEAAEIVVLDADTLEVLHTAVLPDDSDQVLDLSFSPDGRWLAAGGVQGRLHLLDTDTWRWTGEPVTVHDNFLLQVEWLPDGVTVVTAGADGRAALFDTGRRLVRAEALPASTEAGEGLAHLVPATGSELTVLSGERPGRRYPLDPSAWLDRACAVAGRDLTPAEWDRYLPGRDRQPTCTDL
jgi:WD40 repeat protein